MGAGSQGNVGSAVDHDPACRTASQGDGLADQLVQGALREVLLAYLYEVHTPIQGCADALHQ
jgi:hypothetical protein